MIALHNNFYAIYSLDVLYEHPILYLKQIKTQQLCFIFVLNIHTLNMIWGFKTPSFCQVQNNIATIFLVLITNPFTWNQIISCCITLFIFIYYVFICSLYLDICINCKQEPSLPHAQ